MSASGLLRQSCHGGVGLGISRKAMPRACFMEGVQPNNALHRTPPPRSPLRGQLVCLGGVAGELCR